MRYNTGEVCVKVVFRIMQLFLGVNLEVCLVCRCHERYMLALIILLTTALSHAIAVFFHHGVCVEEVGIVTH